MAPRLLRNVREARRMAEEQASQPELIEVTLTYPHDQEPSLRQWKEAAAKSGTLFQNTSYGYLVGSDYHLLHRGHLGDGQTVESRVFPAVRYDLKKEHWQS